MRKLCIILLAVIAAVAMAGNYSAHTKLRLHRGNASCNAPALPTEQVQAFVTADSVIIGQLRAAGVQVGAYAGGVATVSVPIGRLGDVSRLAGVRSVDVAQRLQLCNDSALLASKATVAQQVRDLPMTYTGKGVMVGVIDCGVDFNHINFLDNTGHTRIERAYLPACDTGPTAVLDGDTLPGSAFETPEELARLTTDDSASIHGTHTTGTAAGSYRGNPYQGVAPDARLVVCSMPEEELTDVNIANSLAYIFSYARQQGVPCVVNMSISDYSGPHDGTSTLCKFIDGLSGPGKFVVLSAGNDGNAEVCLKRDFSAQSDTLGTLLANRYGGINISAYLSLWSSDSTAHAMRMVVADRTTGQKLWTSQWSSSVPADSVMTIASEQDEAFARYYDGQVLMASAIEPNGKFHTVVSISAHHLLDNALLGVQVVSAGSGEVRAWCNSYTRFRSFGLDGWSEGDNSMTISDLCTGDSAITVGSYNTRESVIMLDGSEHVAGYGASGQVSTFSSFGPDVRGIRRPEVLAPGSILISSYNRYDTIMTVSPQWVTGYAERDAISYPYGINMGTSMATPVVTGAIALWLQAKSDLTVSGLRQVLAATCRSDAFTQAEPQRSGYGKIDVSAGLSHLLKATGKGDLNGDGKVNVSDLTTLINLILTGQEASVADLNGDGAVNVSDVTFLVKLLTALD